MKKLLALFGLLSNLAFAQSSQRIASIVLTHGSADPTVAEASDFTAVADSSGSLAGTYFKVYDPAAHCYAAWFKVSGTGTAPVVAGCSDVEVDISTGDTNSTVAGAARTALNAAPVTSYFAITGATTHVIITSLTKGLASDGDVGTSGFSVSKTQGVSSTAAISSSAVLGNVVGWKICNDAVNTSNNLFVGEGVDTEVDGVVLDKDKCFTCDQCRGDSLKLMKVSAQAASNGYNVIQYIKQ